MKRIGLILLLNALAAAQSDELKKKFERADRELVRPLPSAFPDLPANLRADLKRRGCSIPQDRTSKQPGNVVRGSFAKTGQTDWAILCSAGRASSVLVYWNGDVTAPAEIARTDDRRFFRQASDGSILFARSIRAVSWQEFARQADPDERPLSPSDPHAAIEDAFPDTGSVYFYFHDGQWIRHRSGTRRR